MSERCIDRQLEFLILVTLYDDADYRQEGVTIDNLLACLPENRLLWMEAGIEKSSKKWKERLDWCLSDLHKNKRLDKKDGKRIFKWNSQSEEGLEQLVGQIADDLELDIEFNGEELTDAEFIQKIADGSLNFSILSSNLNSEGDEANRLILTTDQSTRLAQLTIQFGVH